MKKFLISLSVFVLCLVPFNSFAADVVPINQLTTSNSHVLTGTPFTGSFSGGRGSGFFSGGRGTDTTKPPSTTNQYFVNIDNEYKQVSSINYLSSTALNFTTIDNTSYTANLYNEYITYSTNNYTNYYYFDVSSDVDSVYKVIPFFTEDEPFYTGYLRNGSTSFYNEHEFTLQGDLLESRWGDNISQFVVFTEYVKSDGSKVGITVNRDFNFDLYDYYVVINLYAQYLPSDFSVKYYNRGGDIINADISVRSLNYCYAGTRYLMDGDTALIAFPGKSITFKINQPFSNIRFDFNSAWSPQSLSVWDFSIVRFSKSVASSQGIDLTDVENYLGIGDSSTSGIISGANSGLGSTTSDFNNMQDKLDEYENLENEYFGKYDSAVVGISDTVTGFTFNQILPARSWLSTQMTTCYNSMGDFKFYILFPVIMGIRLIFIGGSVSKKY